MLGQIKQKQYKKCPRCGEKTFAQATRCDNCNLIFSRLQFASNKLAKKEIAKGNRERVIKSRDMPKDVKKWKLILMCFLGGWFGLHNIYIGRYVKGFFSLIFMMIISGLLFAMNSALLANLYSTFLFIPTAFVAFFWLGDLLMICIGKYKIPIAIDMPEVKAKEEIVGSNKIKEEKK